MLLAADIYEHGQPGLNQEWESEDSIQKLASTIIDLGYHCVVHERSEDIVRFILESIETKGRENLIVFNLVEGYQSRNREAYIPTVCEYLGVCFTGSDSYAQIISLDKNLMKSEVMKLGIATPKSILLQAKSWLAESMPPELDLLDYPLFIKPNGEGSSLGIQSGNIIQNESQLRTKIADLFSDFEELLIEEFIPGEDLTVGILGYPGNYFVTDIGRLSYTDEVYSQLIKSKGLMTESISFDVPTDVSTKVKMEALQVSEKLKIIGPSRLDFRFNPKGIYFLEANLTPGLSQIYSALPLLWKQAGASYLDLIQNILASAEWHYKNSKSFQYGKGGHFLG